MSNAYKLKKLLNDKKGKLTDKDIFPTPFFENYLAGASTIFYKRFNLKANKIKVIWDASEKAPTAYTTNVETVINPASKIIQGAVDRVKRYKLILGLKFHEDGHRLFTNFQADALYLATLEGGNWFPNEPDVGMTTKMLLNKASLEKFIREDKKNANKLFSVAHHLGNCIEDGRIEDLLYVLCRKQGDFINGLNMLREVHYDDMPNYADMKQKVENEEKYYAFNMITQMILSYAKFNEFKGMAEDDYDDEIAKVVMGVTDYIDEMISCTSAIKTFDLLNKILITLWPQIQEYFESIKEDEKSDSGSGSESGSEGSGGGSSSVSENLSKNTAGTTEAGSSTSAGIDETKLEEEIAKATGGSSEGSGKSEAGVSAGEEDGSPASENPGVKEISKEEGGRIPYHETSELSSGSGASITRINDYEDYENKLASKQLEDLMNSIAESKVDDDLEKELKKGIEDKVSSIKFSKAHENISIEIKRPKVTESYKEEYRSACKELGKIAKESARRVKPLLETEDMAGYAKNKYYGTKFNASSVVNQDFKYFSLMKESGEIVTLAVGLRVDESGSMSGFSRATKARAAAITLWEFCRECDVPIAIYGDTADESHNKDVSIITYADFDKPDENDRYRLMGIQARSNNRDGAAIQIMAERLLTTNADVKLLIVISDGQPAATGYHGSAAEKDMSDIVKEYSRKGITFFAAAIGSDKDAIKRIYGDDRFLDITNLNDLPKTLTMLVKRHIAR